MGLRSLAGLILAGLILVACDSTTPTITITPTQANPTLIPTSAASNVTATSQPTLANPTAILTLPTLPTTASTPNELTTTVATTITAGANPVADAAQKFNEAKSYSFEVSQTAKLQTGTSVSELSAQGSGLFVAGNFSQTLVLKAGGASQPLEIFVQGDKGYQKLSNLAVWRKLDNHLYKFAAIEPPSILQTAINAKTVTIQGQQQVGTVLANKYSYSVNGAQFVDGQGEIGPLPLGLLSAATILNGFAASDLKAVQIQETLWLDPATNLLLQRQWQLTSGPSQPNHLLYQALYIYHDFNQPDLNIPVPTNLP